MGQCFEVLPLKLEMLIKTPYPKKGFRFTNDAKLTLLIILWVLDKLVMGLMIWVLN